MDLLVKIRMLVDDGVLSERERDVLRQYFFDEITLWEIGVNIGKTESRACQIIKDSIRKIRKELGI